MRNSFQKMLDHFGRRETKFFAAHSAKKPTEREEPESCTLRLIEKRTKAFTDGAVIGNSSGKRFLSDGACCDSRRRRTHQFGGIGSRFAEREVQIGEGTAFRVVGVYRPEQD